MVKKYKFILTLPDDFEVDSALEIEGHLSWPNYSQAEPIRYKGVFDTSEEAEKNASDFAIYKWTASGYDSYYDEEEPHYYVSIFDAEDAATTWFGIEPGDMLYPHPDEYRIEEITLDEETVYKYILRYNNKMVFDSYDEDDLCFESYEEAEEAAGCALDEYDIEEEGECPYELETVEILGIRIEEFEVLEKTVEEFQIEEDMLVKYNGDNTNVIIPDGVKSIGRAAFKKCANIISIQIPSSVSSFGKNAQTHA
jgi:hypothetical protein